MKNTYDIYFGVKFDDGTAEYVPVSSIKKAMTMLQEIDIEKSKCDAKITIFKMRKQTKNELQN